MYTSCIWTDENKLRVSPAWPIWLGVYLRLGRRKPNTACCERFSMLVRIPTFNVWPLSNSLHFVLVGLRHIFILDKRNVILDCIRKCIRRFDRKGLRNLLHSSYTSSHNGSLPYCQLAVDWDFVRNRTSLFPRGPTSSLFFGSSIRQIDFLCAVMVHSIRQSSIKGWICAPLILVRASPGL